MPKIDDIEQRACSLDVITSFACRGWALYEVGLVEILTPATLIPFIELGPVVGDAIQDQIRYAVLPMVQHPDSAPEVLGAMRDILSRGRGPYYIDMERTHDETTGQVFVQPIGCYLIDAVIQDAPFLELIIDPRLSHIRDPGGGGAHDAIHLHLSEMHRIRTQMQLAFRGLTK